MWHFYIQGETPSDLRLQTITSRSAGRSWAKFDASHEQNGA